MNASLVKQLNQSITLLNHVLVNNSLPNKPILMVSFSHYAIVTVNLPKETKVSHFPLETCFDDFLQWEKQLHTRVWKRTNQGSKLTLRD